MAKVKLHCGVYGEGTVFSVRVALDADVEALQKAIVDEKKGVNRHFNVDPAKLTLYLAKKDGEWLKSNRTLRTTLKQGRKEDSDFVVMVPLWPLDDNSYFGKSFKPERKDVHLLVELPPPEAGASAISSSETQEQTSEARQKRRETRVEQIFASLFPRNTAESSSDGSLGQSELGRLGSEAMTFDVAQTEDEEPFWSEEQQDQADAITSEAYFDAFITPIFSDMLASCGMVFVNSERYQWLRQSHLVSKSTDLKPVGFATHRGMFRAKPEPNDGVRRPNGLRFGVAEEELFDCLILFESKLTQSY